MTRLLICTPTHALQGGVERILEALAKGLPSRGFEVVFALARGARFHDPDRFRAAFPAIRGVDVDGTSGTAYGRRRALRRVIEQVDPDVVLNARMFDVYPVCAALKRAGHRLRLAVTVQAFEQEYLFDLQHHADFVDLCVTSGEGIADEARKILPPERVVSIPGGVAPAVRPAIHHEGPLRIGYVGRLEEMQKRVLDLPRMVEKLTIPFTLDVAGDGSAAPALREALPDAHFHGWLPTDALYERVYPELDVLVHFAEWEGVTIAPREAMAHGVVPVVSRFPGLEREGQMIDSENALTFPVGDVQAAADAVERLHRDRALLARLSANAAASQTGIRSEEGAIDAWAAAFRTALALPARVSETLPAAPVDQGLLTRLHVPGAVAEIAREARKRQHGDPGSEWPHWSGLAIENAKLKIENGQHHPFNFQFSIFNLPQQRQQLGAIVHDVPRFERHIRGNYNLIHNRDEQITTDGRGVRCEWEFTSDLHIAKVFPSAGQRLMRRALREWPIVMTDVPFAISDAPEVSFVIGHRGLARLPNLLATLRSIAGQAGTGIECVVIEQSAAPEVESQLPSWVRYRHTPVAADFPYCRSATFNDALRLARGRTLILHDNDFLVPQRYAQEVAARANEGAKFIDLKRFLFYLTEADTRAIFAGSPLRDNLVTTIVQNLHGGSIAATREAYEAIGGFDEDFVGWGGEDNDFWERAYAHGGVHAFGYLPMVHLWHAPQPEKLQPDAPAVRRYWDVIRHVPAEERIRRLREKG